MVKKFICYFIALIIYFIFWIPKALPIIGSDVPYRTLVLILSVVFGTWVLYGLFSSLYSIIIVGVKKKEKQKSLEDDYK